MKIINKVINTLSYFKLLVEKARNRNGFIYGKNLKIDGIPRITIKKECKLKIGDNVLLNSSNRSYHVNMYSPVKIMADRPGAEILIGSNTRIHGSCIHAYKKISIGENCLIAANCQIFDGSGHDLSFPDVANRINSRGDAKDIIIEDNVWIGANCIVLPGVKIGCGSVIAAGSVVVKDIPPMCVAGGNPAKVIREYKD